MATNNKKLFAEINRQIEEEREYYNVSKQELAMLKHRKDLMKDAIANGLPEKRRKAAIDRFREIYIKPLDSFTETYWKCTSHKDPRWKPVTIYLHLMQIENRERLLQQYEHGINLLEKTDISTEWEILFTEDQWFDKVIAYVGASKTYSKQEYNPLFGCTQITISEGRDGMYNIDVSSNGFVLNQLNFHDEYEKITKEEFNRCFKMIGKEIEKYRNETD